MNELNLEDVKQVSGGNTCTNCCHFHLVFTIGSESSASAGLAQLLADFFNGTITDVNSFLTDINNEIAKGTNFNKIHITDLQIMPH